MKIQSKSPSEGKKYYLLNIKMAQKSNFKFKVELSKIICFPKEGEFYQPSLIAIGKYDWEITNNKVSKRKYMVYINLWIIQLFFDFILPVKTK